MKKLVEMRGILEYPVAVGCAAFIKPEGKEAIRTSSVIRFAKLPSGTMYIETKNTYYVLRPVRKAILKGVQS